MCCSYHNCPQANTKQLSYKYSYRQPLQNQDLYDDVKGRWSLPNLMYYHGIFPEVPKKISEGFFNDVFMDKKFSLIIIIIIIIIIIFIIIISLFIFFLYETYGTCSLLFKHGFLICLLNIMHHKFRFITIIIIIIIIIGFFSSFFFQFLQISRLPSD